jgi:hypothetical protein
MPGCLQSHLLLSSNTLTSRDTLSTRSSQGRDLVVGLLAPWMSHMALSHPLERVNPESHPLKALIAVSELLRGVSTQGGWGHSGKDETTFRGPAKQQHSTGHVVGAEVVSVCSLEPCLLRTEGH